MLIGIDPKLTILSPQMVGKFVFLGMTHFSVLNHFSKKNISSIMPKLMYQGKKKIALY